MQDPVPAPAPVGYIQYYVPPLTQMLLGILFVLLSLAFSSPTFDTPHYHTTF